MYLCENTDHLKDFSFFTIRTLINIYAWHFISINLCKSLQFQKSTYTKFLENHNAPSPVSYTRPVGLHVDLGCYLVPTGTISVTLAVYHPMYEFFG